MGFLKKELDKPPQGGVSIRLSGLNKPLIISLSLFLTAVLSFLAVFFFTDIFRGETEPAVTESSGSGKTETTVMSFPPHPGIWYFAALMPYAIVRTIAPTDETAILYCFDDIKCRKYSCEVLYTYMDDGGFYEATEVYIPVFSDGDFTDSRTMLIMIYEDGDRRMPVVLENTTEYFPFVDGRLVIPESLKNGRSYRPLMYINEAIEDKNNGGRWSISLPAKPIDTGMTIDEVCAFFEGMNKAVQEYAALYGDAPY